MDEKKSFSQNAIKNPQIPKTVTFWEIMVLYTEKNVRYSG